ncbi:MAG: peptidylprolyl isomerase [Candidatus Nitrosopolaris sp.]
MARSQDPNGAGLQFFIVLKDSKFLDGKDTVFGIVTSGMDAVDKIAALRTDSSDSTSKNDKSGYQRLILFKKISGGC